MTEQDAEIKLLFDLIRICKNKSIDSSPPLPANVIATMDTESGMQEDDDEDDDDEDGDSEEDKADVKMRSRSFKSSVCSDGKPRLYHPKKRILIVTQVNLKMI